MPPTITFQANAGKQPMAPTYIDRIRVEGDTSYPQTTGGYDLGLAALLPGKTVLGVSTAIMVGSDWITQFDRATGKLKVVVISTGAEVANGVDLAALDVELLVFSK